jgi:hypothetical protein
MTHSLTGEDSVRRVPRQCCRRNADVARAPHELDRTHPAWEALDLDGVLADGRLPALSQDAHRHQGADDLLRRPCLDDAP